MTYILEDIDRQIMEQRDKKRYRLKNAYEIDVDTLFVRLLSSGGFI